MKIDSYSFGDIEIDGDRYTNDVKVFPDRVEDNWWRKEGHSLHPDDIEDIIEKGPDVLVVGTGAYGRMKIPSKTRKYIESEDIELIMEKSGNACETYNEISEEKMAVAAIHLTC